MDMDMDMDMESKRSLSACLGFTYFVEIENFLLKIL